MPCSSYGPTEPKRSHARANEEHLFRSVDVTCDSPGGFAGHCPGPIIRPDHPAHRWAFSLRVVYRHVSKSFCRLLGSEHLPRHGTRNSFPVLRSQRTRT